MPSHHLMPDKTFPGPAWLLAWDDVTLTLRGPDGEVIFEVPASEAHRIVDVYDLEGEGDITFNVGTKPLTFKANPSAARDLRELVMQGLRTDAPFREAQRRHARVILPTGLVLFVVCGGLFALYCWWASWAPEPPRGHWIRYVGPLIHVILLVLLAFALAGPYAAFVAWRQLRRIRAIERSLAASSP